MAAHTPALRVPAPSIRHGLTSPDPGGYPFSGMARRVITGEFYNLLLEGFRASPANAAHAARVAGCDRRTALRAWHHGWPAFEWARPIKVVLADEGQRARRELDEAILRRRAWEEAERRKLLEQLAATRAQVSNLIEATRGTCLAVLAGAARMAPAIQQLAERLNQELGVLAADPFVETTQHGDGSVTRKRVGPDKMMALLERYARMVQRASFAAAAAMRLELMHVGIPSVAKAAAEEMTLEEAVREIEATYRDLRRAQERGLVPKLEVIEGGKSSSGGSA